MYPIEYKLSHIICLVTLCQKRIVLTTSCFVVVVTQQNSLVPIESHWHTIQCILLCCYGNGAYDVVINICFGSLFWLANHLPRNWYIQDISSWSQQGCKWVLPYNKCWSESHLREAYIQSWLLRPNSNQKLLPGLFYQPIEIFVNTILWWRRSLYNLKRQILPSLTECLSGGYDRNRPKETK